MNPTTAARADSIAEQLMSCLPSKLLEPAQLTHMNRVALAAQAGCEMETKWVADSLHVNTKHEILITKDDAGRFCVYERRPGEAGRLKARIAGVLNASHG